MKKGKLKRNRILNCVKTIFRVILNCKILINGTVSKIKKYCKNYIYELFRISQCKTGNEFRKSQQPDFSGVF